MNQTKRRHHQGFYFLHIQILFGIQISGITKKGLNHQMFEWLAIIVLFTSAPDKQLIDSNLDYQRGIQCAYQLCITPYFQDILTESMNRRTDLPVFNLISVFFKYIKSERETYDNQYIPQIKNPSTKPLYQITAEMVNN